MTPTPVTPTILLVEDEPELRHVVAEALEEQGFAVAQSADAADALTRLDGFAYDGLLLDLGLPDVDGMEVLDAAVRRYPEIRPIIMTGREDVTGAVEAMRRGAVDYITKPFPLLQLAQRLHHSLSGAPVATTVPESDTHPFGNIFGTAPSMQRLLMMLERVAPMHSTVLIQGETGTGKELVARTIHHNSPRRNHPFVAFSAAAIPDGLSEAELFGHVKGAFTGAVASRVGRFEAAHGGTLFIDEVSSMSLALQVKLLRALQEREIERVGESRPFKTDVRVIAASNTDLRRLVDDGGFRQDLYYRLNVVPIQLPPLRERREDIPTLVHRFVQKACDANGIPVPTVSQATMRLLMEYSWPGNVRQLENAIEHAVVMSGQSGEVTPDGLPAEVGDFDPADHAGLPSAITIPDSGINLTSVVSRLEHDLIKKSLEKTGGNKRQAARLLNLSRTTLIDKLHRLSQAEESVTPAASRV